MGETVWNGFAICGIIVFVLLVYGIIRMLIDEFRDWRRKRKEEKWDRSKTCETCSRIQGVDRPARCETCKRNEHHTDNWC